MTKAALLLAAAGSLWAAPAGKGPAPKAGGSPPPAYEEDFDDANVESAGGVVKFGEAVRVAEGEHIDGPIVVVGGPARIDGAVNGPVVAIGGSIELGPRSEVNGPAVAVGGDASRSPGAHVAGPVIETPGARLFGTLAAAAAWMAAASVSLFALAKLAAGAGWVVLGLALVAVFPEPIERTRAELDRRPGPCAMAGLLLWPAAGMVSAAFAFSILGLPLVPLLLAAAMAAYVWGFAALALWLGGRVAKDRWDSPFISMAIGMLLLKALQWVPLVHWGVCLLAALPGAGAAALSRFGSRRD